MPVRERFGRKKLIKYLYDIDVNSYHTPEEITHYIFSELSNEFLNLGNECFENGQDEEGYNWYYVAGYLAGELF